MQPAFDFLMEMTDLPDISVLSLSGESLEFASVSLLPRWEQNPRQAGQD
ncbi:hypothetical protein FHS76_000423 [Ochrobactrum daejeonense]|uniref:Uncharacterized protein n=1 Tax=Brucella daejeonensis TaxID=659015 RepID=A0A7W9AU20_9HYPH|nr:hypothetical protein [Brucella daejeonensis]MBB5700585.1 hypothetical protein [Brucella daejeonensis]